MRPTPKREVTVAEPLSAAEMRALFEAVVIEKVIPTVPQLRLLSKPGLLALLGNTVAYATVWKWMKFEGFPKPILLSGNTDRGARVFWVEQEVNNWIMQRPRRAIGQGEHDYRGPRDSSGKPSPVKKGGRRKTAEPREVVNSILA
jgi:predicted DNA-binding transcriptional regulator AlpA